MAIREAPKQQAGVPCRFHASNKGRMVGCASLDELETGVFASDYSGLYTLCSYAVQPRFVFETIKLFFARSDPVQ
jgi:hypothetical protein